jgi:hypothetical protein
MNHIQRNLCIALLLGMAALLGESCSTAFGQDPIAVATELTVNDIDQMLAIQNNAINNGPAAERSAHENMRNMLLEMQNRLLRQREQARTLVAVVPAPVVVAPVVEEKPSCCSGKKKTTPTGTCCGKPKESCCCKQKCVEEHIVYLVDNSEFAGEVDAIDGPTCNGPLHVGGSRVWGKGSEASTFAGVLHRRALDDRKATEQQLLAQRCARPCVGFMPCRGFLPGPSAFPIGPGFMEGPAVFAGPAVIPGPAPHGSGCSGYCPCREHAAAVRLRYGPSADPRRFGCMCPQPCRSCAGNMVYVAGP